MEIFIKENGENPKFFKQVEEVTKLKNVITKIFKIEQDRIENIKIQRNKNKYPEGIF